MLAHSFVRCLILVSCLQQCADHLLVVERFHDEVGSTFLDARHGKLYVGVCGKEHNLGLGAKALYLSEPKESFIPRIDATRKVHVEQYHVGMFLPQLGWYGVRVGYGDDGGIRF